MPEAVTKYFGLIEYQPDAIVQFPCGLPSFEEELEFLVLEPPASAPIVFLQSLRRPDTCFLALPIQVIAPDYQLAMTKEDLESLGLPSDRQPAPGDGVTCFAIIVVTKNGRINGNLLAPIVINPATRVGLQSIRLDSRYSHQHPVGEDLCL